MPDYIYLLENRLSADQQNALRHLREAAREAGTILFLTGDAVRDLTSGHAVRELEVAVHGNALKLKKPIEKLGGKVWGEDEASRALYLCFPGTVRVDLVSTHRVEISQARQDYLSPRFHSGGPPPPRLHGQRHGHLSQRRIVRAADGPHERRRGHRVPNPAPGLQLRFPGRAITADSRHALHGAPGLGDGPQDPHPLL